MITSEMHVLFEVWRDDENDKIVEMDRTMPSPLRMTRAAPWLQDMHGSTYQNEDRSDRKSSPSKPPGGLGMYDYNVRYCPDQEMWELIQHQNVVGRMAKHGTLLFEVLALRISTWSFKIYHAKALKIIIASHTWDFHLCARVLSKMTYLCTCAHTHTHM